jgi:Ni,Fe-hydrogenase maturation factor
VPLGAGAAGPAALVHHVDPTQLLVLAGQLYGRAPEAFLFTVGVASMELGEGLSQLVATTVPNVVAAIHALLTEHAVLQKPASQQINVMGSASRCRHGSCSISVRV